MNTRRSTAIREEGYLFNERIPPRVCPVTFFFLKEENEEIPLQEPQVPLEPLDLQGPQVLPMSQTHFVELDETNA